MSVRLDGLSVDGSIVEVNPFFPSNVIMYHLSVDCFSIVVFQGTVLSAFFWGYAMTQVLGGYFSDKIGGDVVITVSGVFWAIITFWTPRLVYMSTSKTFVLTLLTVSRVLMGCFQGLLMRFYFVCQMQ